MSNPGKESGSKHAENTQDFDSKYENKLEIIKKYGFN